MKIPLLLLLILNTALHAVAAAAKWHPGHYVFIAGEKLTPEVLTLPHFRGVQKIFTWRQLEPAEGRYDFLRVARRPRPGPQARPHGRQLVVQLTHKSFTKGARSVPDYIQGPEFGGGVSKPRCRPGLS